MSVLIENNVNHVKFIQQLTEALTIEEIKYSVTKVVHFNSDGSSSYFIGKDDKEDEKLDKLVDLVHNQKYKNISYK